MRSRLLMLFNGVVGLTTLLFLFLHFSNPPTTSSLQSQSPQSQFAQPDQYLAYVIYPSQTEGIDTNVQTMAFPLTTNKEIDTAQSSKQLFSQSEPSDCQTDDLYSSPNGRYLLIQYNCHTTLLCSC